MSKRNVMILTGAVTGMLVLIFDSRTASEGVRQGIAICLQTLIPSLFPFFVLSCFVTSALFGQTISCLSAVGRFCQIPEGSESILAVGLLGGYPVGAGTVWTSYTEGKLTADEANRMAIFCNNAGPSFLFGILGPMFPKLSYVWCLWVVQILAALLTAYLLGGNRRISRMSQTRQISMSDALNRAIRNMAAVCGWVILFRMILEFGNRWFLWQSNPVAKVLATGILELSNGCLLLQNISDPAIRFLVASTMLSIGGFCILMQTHAVFPELRIKQYLTGKLVHLILSLILSVSAVFMIHGKILPCMFCLVVLIIGVRVVRMRCRKSKIAVAIA